MDITLHAGALANGKCHARLPRSSAGQPLPRSSAGQPVIPIFEAAYNNGMWLSLPAELSATLYQKYSDNNDDFCTFPWGNTIYEIDFLAWELILRSVVGDRRRSVRLIWVSPESVDPTWTEQIPP